MRAGGSAPSPVRRPEGEELARRFLEAAAGGHSQIRVVRIMAGWASLTDAEARVAVLAADGYSNPAIARELFLSRVTAAPYTDVRPGRSCAWYAYWDHSPLTELWAELRHGIFAGAFPTHSAQVLAFVQLPVTAWRPGRGEQDLRAGLARCPSVAAGLDNAELPGRVVGVRDLPTYFRRAAGTGWALVGDAAHHKDPLAARGIADALLSAELLADHVLRGWDNDLRIRARISPATD